MRRSGELKGVDLHALASALESASAQLDGPYATLRGRWLDRLLGADRDDQPLSAHFSYVRRLSPLASTYTKERAVAVCLETLPRSASTSPATSASGSTSTTAPRRTRERA